MSKIILADKQGRIVPRSQMFEAARSCHPDRTHWELDYRDTWRHLSSYNYKRIVSDSQRLFANMGVIKGASIEKADYSIGNAWQPRFLGADREWGDKAEVWLEEWHRICNILGPPFDWNRSLKLISLCVDRDGRCFILFTYTATGWPLIQFIPGHRVGNRRSNKIEEGPYKGLRCINGVILNEYGRAVAYNVLGDSSDEDRIIPAKAMIQVFNPEWWDAGTGLPSVTHAVNDLHDLKDSQDFEKMAMKAASAIGLLEWNERGEAPPEEDGGPVQIVSSASGGEKVTYESMLNGMIRYFKAGSGSKLESFVYNRPPEAWHKFIEYILRTSFAGMRWPIEIAWDSSKIGGANVRLVGNKAKKSIEANQAIIAPIARRIDVFAVAAAISAGWLESNEEWYMWGHTLPAHLTVDDGRDRAGQIDAYRVGFENLSDVLAVKGKDLEAHLRERAKEEKLKDEIAAEYGIDSTRLGFLTPNGNAPQSSGYQQEQEQDDEK